jgi:hypothetical protein
LALPDMCPLNDIPEYHVLTSLEINTTNKISLKRQ